MKKITMDHIFDTDFQDMAFHKISTYYDRILSFEKRLLEADEKSEFMMAQSKILCLIDKIIEDMKNIHLISI